MANSSFGIIAIIASISNAYSFRSEGYAGLPAGIISLCCYLILCPSTYAVKDGSIGVILKDWTGGKGMIGAIVAGLLTGWIYSIFMKKKITIKMPDSVPEGVSNAFSALIPDFDLILGSGIIYAICTLGFGKTPIEIIYAWLQTPLQGMTDSFGGADVMGLMIPFMLILTIVAVCGYASLRLGLIPLYSGVMVPWTAPIIISGLFVGDWRTAVFQALEIVLSAAMYYPFVNLFG